MSQSDKIWLLSFFRCWSGTLPRLLNCSERRLIKFPCRVLVVQYPSSSQRKELRSLSTSVCSLSLSEDMLVLKAPY